MQNSIEFKHEVIKTDTDQTINECTFDYQHSFVNDRNNDKKLSIENINSKNESLILHIN